MKRKLCLFIALLMLVSLSACISAPAAANQQPRSDLVVLSPDSAAAAEAPEEQEAPPAEEPSAEPEKIAEDGVFDSKEDVALYIATYGKLPSNFITKNDARALGWDGGSVEAYAPEKCIGGDRFGNYEGKLPAAKGRVYRECDINTLGAKSRGAERIIYSNDGLVFYTGDHYESFELLYGG